jgi:hypothetical protein
MEHLYSVALIEDDLLLHLIVLMMDLKPTNPACEASARLALTAS